MCLADSFRFRDFLTIDAFLFHVIRKISCLHQNLKNPNRRKNIGRAQLENIMENAPERRLFKRIEAKRAVVIAREDSDNFLKAELINHSSHGVCFLSTHPFHAGERLYIITKNQPIDDFNDKITEAYCAYIIWCGKSEDRYRIGAAIAKTDLLDIAIANALTNVSEEHVVSNDVNVKGGRSNEQSK